MVTRPPGLDSLWIVSQILSSVSSNFLPVCFTFNIFWHCLTDEMGSKQATSPKTIYFTFSGYVSFPGKIVHNKPTKLNVK